MKRLIATAAALVLAGATQAATILGNLSTTVPGTSLLFGSTTSITENQSKAAAFTVDQDLKLGSVFLGLSNFDTLDVYDIFIGSLSGTTISRLASLALTAPARTASNEALVWQLNLSGIDQLLLTPGTTYALTLAATGSVSNYTWGREGLVPIPPTGLATFGNYYFSNNGGLSYEVSDDPDLTNSFAIDGVPVPVPAPVTLLPAALALLALRRRQPC